MSELPLPGRFEWRAARATIPMAAGLSVAAFRASVMPRTWALLMTALTVDNAASMAIGLDRQKIAREWARTTAHLLPERFQDLFDKAWVGPLGLLSPFLDLFAANSFSDAVGAIPAIVITVAIWGLFGGAICRIAATRMTNAPMPGYFAALAFAARHARGIWGPPLIMGSLALTLIVILAILGSFVNIPVIGQWLAWAIIPLMLIPAGILALGISGVLLGWPMMLGAAMAEEADSFDALSQSQCYLFQAPVTWALTIKIGLLVHTAGYFLVRWFLRVLVGILHGSVGVFGMFAVQEAKSEWAFPDPWTMPELTSDAFAFWTSAIELAAVTWPTGFVFAFSAALYLALKARVDLVPPQDVRIE